jgi:hypothetical protein
MADYGQDQDWTEAQRLLEQAGKVRTEPAAQTPNMPSTWQQSLDMINKYHQGQSQTPQRPEPTPEAAPERDDSKTYWAMALSLLGNNGRDLGNIMQSSADNYNRRLSAWEQRNSPDAKLDRSLKVAQLNRADRDAANEPLDEALKIAPSLQTDRASQIQQDQFSKTQQAQALYHQADTIEHRANEKYLQQGLDARQARELAHADRIAAETRDGMDARQDKEIAAQQARQDEQIRANMQLKALEAQQKIPAPIPGTSFNGPEGQRRYETLLPGQREKIDEAVVTGREVNGKLQHLRELMLAPRSSANETDYNSTLMYLIGSETKEGATGTLQPSEYKRYLTSLPKYGAVTDMRGKLAQVSSPQAAWELMRGQNPSLNAIDTLSSSLGAMAQTRASTYGIRDDTLVMGAPQQQQTQGGGGAGVGGPQTAQVSPAASLRPCSAEAAWYLALCRRCPACSSWSAARHAHSRSAAASATVTGPACSCSRDASARPTAAHGSAMKWRRL